MNTIGKTPAGYRAAEPEKLHRARFVERPNRFLVRCDLDGLLVEAFLPNPGRLWEILLPGTELFLSDDRENQTRKTNFTVIAAKTGGSPVLLHTHFSNDAAEWLLRSGKVPGLEKWMVKKREVTFGRSRFDFLLEREGRTLLLEVKSCTLFGERLAMFPNAPSDRGRKHVEELGKLAGEGYEAAVLFLVQSSKPDFFLPDFHTDPKFAESLYGQKERIGIIPLAVEWNEALELTGEPKLLSVPWDVYRRHGLDEGDCLVILDSGAKGFWVAALHTGSLVSSVRNALRKRGGGFPFAEEGEGGVRVIPIRSALLGGEDIGDKLASIAAGELLQNGKRYFYFPGSPMKNSAFVGMLLHRKTDALLEGLV